MSIKKLTAIMLILTNSLVLNACSFKKAETINENSKLVMAKYETEKIQASPNSLTIKLGIEDDTNLNDDLFPCNKENANFQIEFFNGYEEVKKCRLTFYIDYKQSNFSISDKKNIPSYEFELNKENLNFPISIDMKNIAAGDHRVSFIITKDIDKDSMDTKKIGSQIICSGILRHKEKKDIVSSWNNTEIKFFNKEIKNYKNKSLKLIQSKDDTPPSKCIRVKKNDTFNFPIAFTVPNNTESILLMATLDGNTINTENKEFLSFKINNNQKAFYKELTFKAPDQGGKYEFTPIIVANPFNQDYKKMYFDNYEEFTLIVE